MIFVRTKNSCLEKLGLDAHATKAEVKAAYRELTKTYHPDKNEGSKESADKFLEIREAYEYLQRCGLPEERTGNEPRHTSAKHKEGDVFINEIFTLSDIIKGVTKNVAIKRKRLCSCGTGCEHCDNTGYTTVTEYFVPAFPPGSTEGLEYKIDNAGDEIGKGVFGRAIIKVSILPDSIFELYPQLFPEMGMAVRYRAKVHVLDLILNGGNVLIPTPDGGKIKHQIPLSQGSFFDRPYKEWAYRKTFAGRGVPQWQNRTEGPLHIEITVVYDVKEVKSSLSKLVKAVQKSFKEKLKKEKKN